MMSTPPISTSTPSLTLQRVIRECEQAIWKEAQKTHPDLGRLVLLRQRRDAALVQLARHRTPVSSEGDSFGS
jgi:hypothetical protein